MKTSKLNYFTEYKKLGTENITENFAKTHQMLSKLTNDGNDWSKVTANKTFSEMAEKQFSYLDMLKQRIGTSTTKPQQDKQQPSGAPRTIKTNRNQGDSIKTNSREAAKKVRKNTAKIPIGSPVETVDAHLVILNRYSRMDGKAIPRERVAALARTLVKQIEARILRKASPHSKLVEQMREQLFEFLDKAKGANIRVVIPPKTKSGIETAVAGEHPMKSVQLLRRYAGMAGKSTTVDKAKRLYNAMVSAVEKEQIPQDDRYFERVIEVMRHLKKYIERGDERKQMPLLPAELSGILGCASSVDELSGIDESDSEEESIDDVNYTKPSSNVERPICSTDFMNRKFQRYAIGEPWVKIFGQIEPGKHTIVFSKEKLGKTTAMVDFAGYLSKHHGPVLFVQKEEGLSGTFQDKLENTRAANPNLFLKEELPPVRELKQYRFVFLDSVSRLNLSPQQLTRLQEQLGNETTLIAILHATKDGKHRGANDYAHDASQIVTFPEFGAAYGYGRFKGTTGELIRFTDPRE